MKKVFPLCILAAVTLFSGCKDSDDTTSPEAEETVVVTPAKSLIGTWYNNLNAFSQNESALTYLSFIDGEKGFYAYIDEKEGFEDYSSFNYTYNTETGEGTIRIMSDPEVTFSAANNSIAMLDSKDSLGLFSKYSDDAQSWRNVLLGYEECNNATSEISEAAGPSTYDPSIIIDFNSIENPETNAVTAKGAEASSGLPDWFTTLFSTIAQTALSMAQNAIVNSLFEKGDESMFSYFTDQEKLNRIYQSISKIDLTLNQFIQTYTQESVRTQYREMQKENNRWDGIIMSYMGRIKKLKQLGDSVEAYKIAEKWAETDNNIGEFYAYLQNINQPLYTFAIQEGNNVKSKQCDYLDFIAQWGLTSYCWNTDMFNFYRAYTSHLQNTINEAYLMSCTYYEKIAPNDSALKQLTAAYGVFGKRLNENIEKLKPDSDEVECLIPHCHISLMRDLNLKDYSKIPADNEKITVKDLYSYEYMGLGSTVLQKSNIAWTLALDHRYSDTTEDDSLSEVQNALLTRSNVDCILKAYENLPDYKGNLPKILLKTAGMSFVSNTPVDTTKLCMLTRTSHGYENTKELENIPLILPAESAWSSAVSTNTASQKITDELGGYTKNLFALTGYKYNSDAPKAHKIGILNVDEEQTRKWFYLWLKKTTDTYTIKGISDLDNNLWLIPFVTKRYNKSAAWDY